MAKKTIDIPEVSAKDVSELTTIASNLEVAVVADEAFVAKDQVRLVTNDVIHDMIHYKSEKNPSTNFGAQFIQGFDDAVIAGTMEVHDTFDSFGHDAKKYSVKEGYKIFAVAQSAENGFVNIRTCRVVPIANVQRLI